MKRGEERTALVGRVKEKIPVRRHGTEALTIRKLHKNAKMMQEYNQSKVIEIARRAIVASTLKEFKTRNPKRRKTEFPSVAPESRREWNKRSILIIGTKSD